MRGKHLKRLALVMAISLTVNFFPRATIEVMAQEVNLDGKDLVLEEQGKPNDLFGPYDGRFTSERAVEPFKEGETTYEGMEYKKDSVLIKMKPQTKLFGFIPTGKNQVNHEMIESLEKLDFITAKTAKHGKGNETDGAWYKAQLKEATDIPQLLKELKKEGSVVVAEPEYIRKLDTTAVPQMLNNDSMKDQWYLDTINVQEAWKHLESNDINPGGSRDVVVAVIDTGVDYNHLDLINNIWTNPMEIPGDGIDNDGNGYIDDIHGINTTDNNWEQRSDPMDDNGHGTHVAGIIAAEANNNTGGVGIAYNVQIMPIKAAQSSGILTSTSIANAIMYAAENGADVINMSFGSYGQSQLEKEALEIAFGTSVLVASAGNDGTANEVLPMSKPMYPAAYPWVLGVMASTHTPYQNGDWLANFSNWDVVKESGFEYELMAPGEDVFSTIPNYQYAVWDGTSMAAPMVSAVAALVRSKYDDKESYSSRFIMGQLASTGVDKQGKTYAMDKEPLKYKELNAFNALTQTPKPNVSYIEHYLFDKGEEGTPNHRDGVVDAGETIDIGMVVRNHWGKADNVKVTIDTNSSAGIADPYVEIITGTTNYGAIGNFGTDDNGLIYENDVVTEVANPLTIKVKENTPNDHVVKLNVTIEAKNGFDVNDKTTYKSKATISFAVRQGTLLPSVIDKDMTLTKEKYWIIPNATVIEEGVTVNVEPGTQIQFWGSEPDDPYAEKTMAYLQVKGNLFVNGTAEEPVEMFASSLWSGYEVKIYSSNELMYYEENYNQGKGNIELNYAKISNPHLNVERINNCYFTQDLFNYVYKRHLYNGKVETTYRGPAVLSRNIENSKFYKMGYKYSTDSTDTSYMLNTDGTLQSNIFDNCVYRFNDIVAENNVLLNNYKIKGEQYGSREYLTSQGDGFGQIQNKDSMFKILSPEKFNYTGSTYFIVQPNISCNGSDDVFYFAQEFAKSVGGNIVTINNEQEDIFVQDYIRRNASNTGTNRGVIGINDIDTDGIYTWISGENSQYEVKFVDNTGGEYAYYDYYNMGYQPTDHLGASDNVIIEIPGISYAEYVTLNNSKLELGAGGASSKLIATIYPENTENKNVTWTSSNPEVASVNEFGEVTPLTEGTTTITVITEDGGHTATCDVLVKTIVPATGIQLNKNELNLEKGKSEKLNAEILPVGATDKRIQWTSSNEEIASVDEFGNVTGKTLGAAQITAIALDGSFEATCDVNVIVPVTGITVDKEFLRLTTGGESVKLNAQVYPADASIQEVIWTTSDENIVIVDEVGNVTPVKAGTAMTTAKSKDGDFKKNVIVTVWDEAYNFNPIKVAAGEYLTVILNEDGSLWVTGQDYKNTPILVNGTENIDGKVIDIATGSNYEKKIYVLTDKGYVYEKEYEYSSFNKISNLTNIVKIASGSMHLLALKNDGTVWAKGFNNYGQLGDGTTDDYSEVIQVDGLADIVDISAGNNSSAAVKSDGSLYTWGNNQGGMLGVGDSQNRLYPTKVNNINNAKKVEVNYNSILYITNNNKLYRSGDISNVGNSNHFEYLDNNVVNMDGSYYDILYVKDDGSLYVGGYNQNGSLGLGHDSGTSITINENIDNVNSIYSGSTHNIAIKNDGSIYAFGKNEQGQLGNMTTTNSNVPVQVLLGILPDDVPPSIIKAHPSNGQSGVEVNPTISITFDETINPSSRYSQIRLKDSTGNVLSIKDKKIDGKVLSFKPMVDLKYGESYSVEIPQNALIDMFGNPNSSSNITFRVKNESLFSKLKKVFTGEGDVSVANKKKAKLKENNLEAEIEKYDIKSVSVDITLEELNEKRIEFINSGKMTQIKNNAILNRWHDPDVDRWMRFTAPNGDNKSLIYFTDNYWGTTSKTLIDKALVDYEDFKSLAKVKYDPILEAAPEEAYPFVTSIFITNTDGTIINKVGAEKISAHVQFNRGMNTNVQPQVTFGPDLPNTDYRISTIDNGQWISDKEWVGEFNITPVTGDGYQFFRVTGAQAADNPWLVTGDDRERFKFEIITSGTESMNLQANGNGNKISLSWFQDDFNTLAGYNIYRAEEENGTYTKINPYIIPSHIKEFEDTKVEAGKTYYYKFTVLQTDMTESDFSNVASAAAVDNVLPTIEHGAITSANVGVPLKISATVTDNVKVEKVLLKYRKTGDSEYSSKDMTNLGNNKYSTTVEGSYITSKGFEYYIEAFDGVTTATHGTVNKPNRVTVVDAPKITAVSPVEGPSKGGTKVIITGFNFKEGAKVKFDGVESKEVVVESSTRLTAVTPSNNPGAVDIIVENNNGNKDILYSGFTYKTEGVKLQVQNVQGKKGSVIEVPITMDYVDGLNSVELEFNYDPTVLSFGGVRTGELTNNFMSAANDVEKGKVSISIAGANAVAGRGNILYVKLEVLKDSQDDKNSSNLEVKELQINGGAIGADVINGNFTIAEGQSVSGNVYYHGNYQSIGGADVTLKSDVETYGATSNSSGYFNMKNVYSGNYAVSGNKTDEVKGITSYDASLVLQSTVNAITLDKYSRIAADVNSDGKVNAVDAAQILAYSAGKVTLPFKGTDKIWKFETYNKNITISDYSQYVDLTGILIGDVSGNWNYGEMPDVRDSVADFNTGVTTKNEDGTYTLPIYVSMSNANLFGTDITINYDSSIGKPIRVEKDSSINTFGLEENLSKEGEINISIAGATPYDTSGEIINVIFESEDGNALSATTTIHGAMVNEDSVNSVVYESKDINCDKKIDVLDIAELAVGYNETSNKPTWKEKLDINKDGIIDIFDLIQVARNM